jgi:hypothetical protein
VASPAVLLERERERDTRLPRPIIGTRLREIASSSRPR